MSVYKRLFFAASLWAGHKHGGRLDLVPGCWEHPFTVDGLETFVSINAHTEMNKSRDGFDVPPFHVLIMINGWPAVLVSPYEGTIMGGDEDTEDKLIAAFEADTPKDKAA